MSLYFLLTVFALVLHSTSAQGTCSELQIGSYILGLPNGAACAAARTALLNAAPTDSALMTFCNANCGRPLAEYQLLNCSDTSAFLSFLTCIPTGDTSSLGAYCRYSFPDLPALDSIFAGLTTCATFSGDQCPAGCAAALMAAQAAVGCCYQSLYNDPSVLYSFVNDLGILSQENATFLQDVIGNDTLWQACGLTMPAACNGNVFPSTSGQELGVCTQSQFDSFESEQLSESCRTNLMHSLDDNALDDLDFDVLCTPDCGGRVADYERTTCKTEFQAALTELSCLYSGDAPLGDRCRFALRNNSSVSSLFEAVGSSCSDLTPETCGEGCAAALQTLSSQMGCCYQSLYNNTFLGFFFLLFSDTYDTTSSSFFATLNNPVIWDVCDVPLIEECQGEPFDVATTATTATTDDGAIKLAASGAVLVLFHLVAMLLY